MHTDTLDGAPAPLPARAGFMTRMETLVRTARPERDLSLLDEEMRSIYLENAQSGLWTANLTTGLLYWSDEVYPIYGFEPGDGPIDFAAAMRCYPDEASSVLYDLIDHAIQQTRGFRFVLPLTPFGASQRITISTIAAYQRSDDDVAEIFGVVAPVEARPLEMSLRD